MYCLRCGQEQISDQMKFCSRCGLQLTGLAQWLASGGMPPPHHERPTSLTSPRRKGIRRGAKLMFLSAVLFPLVLVLSLAIDEGAPMIVPILIFFISLVLMLYARLFSSPSPIKSQQVQTPGLNAIPQAGALPPASNIPMHGPGNLAGQQVRTNELAHPPSVTEHTTKLLDQE
jgi:hypothetical protein